MSGWDALQKRIDDVCEQAIRAGRGEEADPRDIRQLYEILIDGVVIAAFTTLVTHMNFGWDGPCQGEGFLVELQRAAANLPAREDLERQWNSHVRSPWKWALRQPGERERFLALTDQFL